MEKKKFIIIYSRISNGRYWIFEKDEYQKNGLAGKECCYKNNLGLFMITERGKEVLKSL